MKIKIAFVHHWLYTMRGGEKVLEAMLELFPTADLFTLFYRPGRLSPVLTNRKVITSCLQPLFKLYPNHSIFLPFIPWAVEQWDFREYKLVISSDASLVKGIITLPETFHLCYCHTPPRYLWGYTQEYLETLPCVKRFLFNCIANYLRIWDSVASKRVDFFVANSYNVVRRINKYYGRDAEVVYPPVEVEKFYTTESCKEFYLIVSQLVPYKRVDIALEAFKQLRKPLIIIGEGPLFSRYKKMIKGSNIKLLGFVEKDKLPWYYAHCKAFIFPGEEDFGITLLEAFASGRPVIAYKRGGALEIVKEGETGLFFNPQTPQALIETVKRFENEGKNFFASRIKKFAENFSKKEFQKNFLALLSRVYPEFPLLSSEINFP